MVTAVKRAKLAGSTVILITHKPTLLFAADKVLVLNEGVVDAFGERNAILPKILPQPPKKAVRGIKNEPEAAVKSITG